MNTKIKSAFIAALGLGFILQANFIQLALAQPSVVNKMIEPMKAKSIIRSRIAMCIVENMNLVESAKTEIMNSAFTLSTLAATANNWNAKANGKGANSKCVSSVQIDPATGEITMTFDSYNLSNIPYNSTLVFTPYIQDGNAPIQLATALATQVTGVMDWGCASTTNTVATRQGLPALTLGTLPAKYAPWECR